MNAIIKSSVPHPLTAFHSALRWAFACVMCIPASLLIGCAGTNFIRPKHSELVLGTTTANEIRSRFGNPYNKAQVQKNGETVQVLNYAFATMDWGSLKPARAESFFFWQDKLVGYTYSSSFKDDNTDFDGTKVSQIQQNVSNRSNVEQLLGPPGGKSIYPLVRARDEHGVSYLYSQTRSVPFGVKIYRKSLEVTFNARDVVTDIEFSEGGEK